MKELTEQQFRKHMKPVKVPEGFTVEWGESSWGFGANEHTYRHCTLKSATVEIKFDDNGSGHTRFKTGESWLTFDRTGVEDSFYHRALFKGDRCDDLNAIVKEQLERVQKRLDYYKSAISLPGIPFTVAPGGIDQLKVELGRRGFITFIPSGFGTGYNVSRKAGRDGMSGRPAPRATAELEKLLGHSPLYVSKFDAD